MDTDTTTPTALRTFTPAEQADNRAAVAAALVSGEYKQGVGYLHRGDCFCWGGVACEVVAKRFPGEVEIRTYPSGTAYNGCNVHLPSLVMSALGIKSAYGRFRDGSLMIINDEGGTFAEIAALLLNPPPGLLDT